jgi:hypothetical protein
MMNAPSLASSRLQLKQKQSAIASTMPIKVCKNLTMFSFSHKIAEGVGLSGMYWTSGTNQGALSVGTFTWCNGKTRMPWNDTIWAVSPKQPNNIWNDRCVVFFMSKIYEVEMSALDDVFCTHSLYLYGVICEA